MRRALAAPAGRRGRSRRRRARAAAPRRRRRDRALLAVVSAARRRPGAGAGAVVLRAGRRARVDRAVPDHVQLRARDRGRDRRLAGVAGARRSRRRRSTSGSTTWPCSAASCGASAELPAKGAAHYLLEQNAALARSLRTRWARWKKTWSTWDGLIGDNAEVPALLADQRLTARPYSVSALQRFSACPFQFLLERDLPLPAARAAGGDRPARSADARRHLPRDPARRAARRCAAAGCCRCPPNACDEAQDILRDVATADVRSPSRSPGAGDRARLGGRDRADARRSAPVARRGSPRRARNGCRATSSSASACRSTTRTTRRACPIRS